MFKCDMCFRFNFGDETEWAIFHLVKVLPFAPYPGLTILFGNELALKVEEVQWDMENLFFMVAFHMPDAASVDWVDDPSPFFSRLGFEVSSSNIARLKPVV